MLLLNAFDSFWTTRLMLRGSNLHPKVNRGMGKEQHSLFRRHHSTGKEHQTRNQVWGWGQGQMVAMFVYFSYWFNSLLLFGFNFLLWVLTIV